MPQDSTSSDGGSSLLFSLLSLQLMLWKSAAISLVACPATPIDASVLLPHNRVAAHGSSLLQRGVPVDECAIGLEFDRESYGD